LRRASNECVARVAKKDARAGGGEVFSDRGDPTEEAGGG